MGNTIPSLIGPMQPVTICLTACYICSKVAVLASALLVFPFHFKLSA